jgi:hypothetical protein
MAVADDVPRLGDIAKLVQYDKLIANNDMQVSTAQEPQRVRQHPFATCMCSIRSTRQSKSQSPKID